MGYCKRIPRNLLPRDWYNAEWERDIMRRGDIRLLERQGFSLQYNNPAGLALKHPGVHLRVLNTYFSPHLILRYTIYVHELVAFDREDVLDWAIENDLIRVDSYGWINDLIYGCLVREALHVFRYVTRKYAPPVMHQETFRALTISRADLYNYKLRDIFMTLIDEEWPK